MISNYFVVLRLSALPGGEALNSRPACLGRIPPFLGGQAPLGPARGAQAPGELCVSTRKWPLSGRQASPIQGGSAPTSFRALPGYTLELYNPKPGALNP